MTEQKITPNYMAHIVLKSKDKSRLADWYKKFFHAEILFSNDFLTFLTFDDEHHRFAIAQLPPESPDLDPQAVGVAHWAYSYQSFDDLVATYQRLKDEGITPHFPVNHGMTISLYYHDPDGNEVEIQVDTVHSPEETKAYFETDAFKANPIGNRFDPDVFAAEYLNSGDYRDAIKRAESAAA